jgi:hypothetical protein
LEEKVEELKMEGRPSMRWGGEGNGEKSAFDVEISFSKCPILSSG